MFKFFNFWIILVICFKEIIRKEYLRFIYKYVWYKVFIIVEIKVKYKIKYRYICMKIV